MQLSCLFWPFHFSPKVFVYEGVKGAQASLARQVARAIKNKRVEEELRQKRGTLPVVHPHQLDGFDIVLISYQTLRAEQAHEEFQAKDLRHARRFPVIPCSVLRASYHRVVLDEAQMVGGGGAVTAAAKMALALEGTHRWAVSGTPFKRTTRDIQGTGESETCLFAFLTIRGRQPCVFICLTTIQVCCGFFGWSRWRTSGSSRQCLAARARAARRADRRGWPSCWATSCGAPTSATPGWESPTRL